MTGPLAAGQGTWRPALLALGLPTLAGLAYMAAFEAPSAYLAVNAIALVGAAAWIVFGRAHPSAIGRRIFTILLLAWLFVPLVTGPELSGVSRWVPLGPSTLHSGMIAIPALAVLAARDHDYAAPILLTALLAGLLQPDAASGFAITFAAVGIHHVGGDWKVGLVCVVGFFASIVMTLRGELPAQPFAERVLVEAVFRSVWAALGLAVALLAGFMLMLRSIPLERQARFGLTGTLFGFIIISLMSNYPSALIGYGAAPILGYGLALGLRSRTPA